MAKTRPPDMKTIPPDAQPEVRRLWRAYVDAAQTVADLKEASKDAKDAAKKALRSFHSYMDSLDEPGMFDQEVSP